MNVNEVANRLVELCQQGDFEACYNELYHPQAISLEPHGAQVEMAKGIVEIKKKGEVWNNMVETVHESKIGTPIIADQFFALPWSMQLTYKGATEPVDMEEICLYEVRDGKIVSEQFFFTPESQEEE